MRNFVELEVKRAAHSGRLEGYRASMQAIYEGDETAEAVPKKAMSSITS